MIPISDDLLDLKYRFHLTLDLIQDNKYRSLKKERKENNAKKGIHNDPSGLVNSITILAVRTF
jgi:hypothetical protein